MQSDTSASTAGSGRNVFESGTLSAELVLLAGRILLGGIFVLSGWGKLMGLSAFAATLEKNGVPAPQVLAVVGAAVEFFGGLAVVLGLRPQLAALLLIAFVIVATLVSHRFWDFEGAAAATQRLQFMKNCAIAGGLLLLSAAGGGRLSLEAALARRLG
jgi:putative oxidoreductase